MAVAYWGGTVRTFDPSGKLLSAKLFPDDVTGLTFVGDLLIVGLSDGEILALK